MPGGVAHRLAPREASIHLRYKPQRPGLEAVAWYADGSSREIARVAFDADSELPQEAYARACEEFNADPAMRRCPATGAELPPIDVAAFRWRETAAEIRALLAQENAPAPQETRSPAGRAFRQPPTPTEPLRVNVYEFTRNAPTALNPMFPYLGPGCMVPCTALHDAAYAGPMGYFLHENTVDEVNVNFGARSSFRRPGAVFVGPHHHGVGDKPPAHSHGVGMKPGQSDLPDMVSISVITQRQSVDIPQREAMTLVCERCDTILVRHPYEAHEVPEPVEGAWSAEILGLPTISQDAYLTDRFNDDAGLRTCRDCGHVNPPFPAAYWGWPVYRRRTQAVVLARSLMARAGEQALRGEAPTPVAETAVSAARAPSQQATARWLQVLRESDIDETGMKEAMVGGRTLLFYRLADGVYCTDGICTHAYAQLALGYLEGDAIECPFHGGSFDIRSGKAQTAPCEIDLATYPVKIEEGAIFVALPTR